MKLTYNHFFPIPCVICRFHVCPREFCICPDCLHKLQLLLTEKCRTCGKPPSGCSCVRENNHRFAFFYGSYTSRGIIYLLKTNSDTRVIPIVTKLCVEACGLKPSSYDAVAFVPRLWKNYKRNGVDQAKEIAKAISKLYGIPVIDCIERIGGKEQKLLSKSERIKNIKDNYKIKEDFAVDKPYRKILLVDDVYTTGATMKTCCSLLRGRVAEGVVAFTLAKTNFLK